MDQQKRLLIAIAASFALTLVFTNFVWKPELEKEQARLAALDAGVQAQAQAVADAGAPVAVAPPPTPTVLEDGGVAQAPAPPAEIPVRTIEVARESMKLMFSTEGGSLQHAELLGKRERQERNYTVAEGYQKLFGKQFETPPQINLATPPAAGPGQFSVAITGASPLSPRAKYQVLEESDGVLALRATEGPWTVDKKFTWEKTGYELSMDVTITNSSGTPQTGDFLLQQARAVEPGSEQSPSLLGGIGNQALVLCRYGDKVERRHPQKEEDATETFEGPVSYIGIDQQYFLSAVWPKDQAVAGTCTVTSTDALRVATITQPLSLAAGQSFTRGYDVFLGPKDIDLLRSIDQRKTGFSPDIEGTIDFGWWAVICKALLFFLRFFHGLVGNWGLAIILLTVMVKVVLLPLTHRAMVSAEAMKKLQPKMEEIKKKFADDRERQNMETMKLYQEAKVNPLGGCLPMLLQLPIWSALFFTLRSSYELYGEPFYGPVWSDLTSKDPTYLLPLALGVTMIITQRLQPQMMDATQAKIMTWGMPIFFTAIMMNYPAGLSLYIFTNNLLSIGQQFALRKYLEKTGQAAPKPPGGGDGKKKGGLSKDDQDRDLKKNGSAGAA